MHQLKSVSRERLWNRFQAKEAIKYGAPVLFRESPEENHRDGGKIPWLREQQERFNPPPRPHQHKNPLQTRDGFKPQSVSLKAHRLCSSCLFCEGNKCAWYDRKIDQRVKLCGGSYWQAKPKPVAKTHASEWLAYINQAKAAYPQYFEGIDLTFLSDMAWEEEKRKSA